MSIEKCQLIASRNEFATSSRTLIGGCTSILDSDGCSNETYLLTEELLYNASRNTRYYAIVGVDLPTASLNKNDDVFNLSTQYTEYDQINEFLESRYNLPYINVKSQGDGMVGVLSQMGWTETSGTTPEKKISMEKIIFDVDTDGGNGSIPLAELFFRFHSKIQHRRKVMEKIFELLTE